MGAKAEEGGVRWVRRAAAAETGAGPDLHSEGTVGARVVHEELILTGQPLEQRVVAASGSQCMCDTFVG